MLTPRSIKPVFEHLDKDLIIRWSSTGNHLLFDKSANTAFGLPWVNAGPVDLIIDYTTVVEPAEALIGSHIVRGYKKWDDLDVENMVVHTPSAVLFDAVLSASLPMANINTPHIQARLRAFGRALFEGSTQTTIQNKAKEIKNWYAAKVNQILEAKNILCKQDNEDLEFVVVVDHIRRDHSFQLSDIACELDDLYPHWDFGFQYVSVRTAGQLPLDEYSDLINDG